MNAWQVLTGPSPGGAFGFDPYFDPDGGRAATILVGLAFSIMGLLIALHVVPAN